MTKNQALRLALEALENIDRAMPFPVAKLAIKECKAALEAKDEPFGFFQYDIRLDAWVQNRINNKGVAFYTLPPQRTWAGLTEEELKPICAEWRIVYGAWMDDFAKDIEAKLKEKNT